MRQAGRSLPEYRALRGEGSILEAIKTPEIAAEVTLQPVRRYGVDAAILFSDIVVPVAAIGFGIDVIPGRGPVAEHPFTSRSDLTRLRPLEVDQDIPYVIETVRHVAAELNAQDTTLIGFAGAPFTVASYLVEGGPSRTFTKVKALMYQDPELWDDLGEHLGQLAPSGADVVGVDWRVPLDEATQRIGNHPLQGNLDPALCFAPVDALEDATRDILRRGAKAPGHIFNLGHGVLPETDPDMLKRVVDLVHNEGRTLAKEAQ